MHFDSWTVELAHEHMNGLLDEARRDRLLRDAAPHAGRAGMRRHLARLVHGLALRLADEQPVLCEPRPVLVR